MSAILQGEGFRFRLMDEDDLNAIMAIEDRAYEFNWSRSIFKDCLRVGYQCHVLEQDKVLVGYLVMSVAAGESHMLNICVNPELQGQGLGRMLMNHGIEIARRLRAESIFLEVRPSNKAALSLYESLGFNEIGIRRGYYPAVGGREDALILALTL